MRRMLQRTQPPHAPPQPLHTNCFTSYHPIVQAEEFDEEVQEDIPAHLTTPNSLTTPPNCADL